MVMLHYITTILTTNKVLSPLISYISAFLHFSFRLWVCLCPCLTLPFHCILFPCIPSNRWYHLVQSREQGLIHGVGVFECVCDFDMGAGCTESKGLMYTLLFQCLQSQNTCCVRVANTHSGTEKSCNTPVCNVIGTIQQPVWMPHNVSKCLLAAENHCKWEYLANCACVCQK